MLVRSVTVTHTWQVQVCWLRARTCCFTSDAHNNALPTSPAVRRSTITVVYVAVDDACSQVWTGNMVLPVRLERLISARLAAVTADSSTRSVDVVPVALVCACLQSWRPHPTRHRQRWRPHRRRMSAIFSCPGNRTQPNGELARRVTTVAHVHQMAHTHTWQIHESKIHSPICRSAARWRRSWR